MMSELLNRQEYRSFLKRTRERKALKSIIKHLNKRTKPKNKHFYLKSLRDSCFSFSECKKLGFKFSRRLWKSCLNQRDRLSGGRPRIAQYLVDGINQVLEENSEISSSRTACYFTKRQAISYLSTILMASTNALLIE